MTLVLARVALPLQVLGLLGSVLAAIAAYITINQCTAILSLIAAGIAIPFDVVALASSSRALALGAIVLKLLAVVAPRFALISCAAPPQGLPDPILPPALSYEVLSYSVLPSLIGAALKGRAR